MKWFRNDPYKYVKRSDIGPKRKDRQTDQRTTEEVHREKDYLIAPIDDAGYIDFSVPARRRLELGG
ncbi:MULTISPECIES: hypothetical protein [unclassified Mesorhizobium]|uniref:hypothetical protein n=1 Tax=unclassified Mesorhizobium TaxID=325217 RepID=UPI00333A38EB